MKSALSPQKSYLVWALLFLTFVGIGSVFIWRGFGELNPRSSLRWHELPVIARSEAIPRPSLRAPEGRSNLVGSGQAPQSPGSEIASSRGEAGGTRNDEEGPEGFVLAVFGQAPEFTLTERNGRTFSKDELLGKPWIANFIFTSCAGQCPLMSLQMKGLQKELGIETGFQFVSFTVDPQRDTPEVLSKYAARYGAEKERWFFLTGPKPQIDRIMKGFFLSPADEPVMHSIRFILIDRKGQMRGYYDSSEPQSMKQLIHDANVIARIRQRTFPPNKSADPPSLVAEAETKQSQNSEIASALPGNVTSR